MADDPWPDNRCTSAEQEPAVLHEFDARLADASDERPLQTFLAAHPQLLTCLLPPGRGAWCFDRPRFGCEYIPDFLLCTHNSTGYEWVLVEIESPTRPPLNGSGLPSGKLNEALGQIRDWRAWLRQNVAYAQATLKFTDLNAECRGYIVIGRRASIAPKHVSRYRELSRGDTVMTYDRLRDCMTRGREFIGATNG